MFKAAWKSLLGRKLRLLMSTFAIVLGVAFVSGALIFTDTLGRSFDAIFASSVGDVVVRPAGGTSDDAAPTTKTLPADLVDDLAEVEGAARADGNVISFGVFVVGENNKVIGGNGAPGLGMNWNDAPAANGLEGLVITDGAAPDAPDEIALDEATAERAGYQIGEQVHLVTSTEQAVLRPTLVGLATFGDGGSANGATITIFDTDTAQDLFIGDDDKFHDAWVTADDGVSQEELRDSVAAALPTGYEVVTGDTAADEAGAELEEAISFIGTFLLTFAGIALVVGSFLIVNTFSILVAQRSRELALLRAVGASKRQVTRSVMFEAVVLGFVGSSLGLGLGVILAVGIRALMATLGLDLSGSELVFAPRTVLAAYAVGIVVTTVAAYLPARRSAKIPPVAALRDDVAMPESSMRSRLMAGTGLGVLGAGLMVAGLLGDLPTPAAWVGGGILSMLLGVAAASPVLTKPVVGAAARLYRRTFGAVGTLAGQNLLRNPRRTSVTASALMIGLALVSMMSILGASAKASVDRTVEENFLGDLVVSNVVGVPFSTSIGDQVEQTEGVRTVSRFRYAVGQLDGHGQGVMGIQPDKLEEVAEIPMVEGEVTDLRDGTMLIGRQQSEERNLSLGDEMTFAFPSGKQSLEIVGVYEDGNGVLGYPYTTTVQTLADAEFEVADNYLLISLVDAADPAAVKSEIDQQTAAMPTVTVKNQEEYAEEQSAIFDQLLLPVYALLGLALIIAVLGIVNTLALSVIERTREVGLLRAVGVSRRQMRRMVRLEAIVIAVLGALLGVGMGIVFGLALLQPLAREGVDVTVVPGVQLMAYVAGAALIGVLAAVFPARRAARLDVLRAIATE